MQRVEKSKDLILVIRLKFGIYNVNKMYGSIHV